MAFCSCSSIVVLHAPATTPSRHHYTAISGAAAYDDNHSTTPSRHHYTAICHGTTHKAARHTRSVHKRVRKRMVCKRHPLVCKSMLFGLQEDAVWFARGCSFGSCSTRVLLSVSYVALVCESSTSSRIHSKASSKAHWAHSSSTTQQTLRREI